jgi:hypothetical protein
MDHLSIRLAKAGYYQGENYLNELAGTRRILWQFKVGLCRDRPGAESDPEICYGAACLVIAIT